VTVRADVSSSSARRQLLDVAARLWPEPAVASLRRHSSQTAQEWLVVPSLRQPRWLLPADNKAAAQALERHDLGQRRQLLPALLASLYRRAPLARLPLARVSVESHAGPHTIEAELSHLLGTAVDVCVRLGRSRQDRALVLRAIDQSGRTLGFVKMATTAEGERALRSEAANLERIASNDISPVIAPALIALDTWNGHLMLVMSALLPPEPGKQRTDVPEAAMLRFAASSGTARLPLQDSPFVARLRDGITSLPDDDRARSVLEAAFARLLERYGERQLTIGCWHGDWVPWNVAWAQEGVQLWDWEHYREGVPVGWDWLHFHAQQLRNRQATSEHSEDQWLAASRAYLRDAVAADADDAAALILSYLLEVNVRYRLDRRGARAAPMRQGWGPALLDRLIHEACR
jgi:hypothetical protein